VSIGETLASARTAAGLTTADVAERTRIRRTLIEAIENDDYRLCGGDVYARGHIGTIARTVGLDPAPLVAEFDRTHQGDEPPRASEVFEADTAMRSERRGPNWSAAMVAALVVVVGLIGWQLTRGGSGSPGTATAGNLAVSSSHASSSPTATTRSPSPTVSQPSSSAAHSSDLAQVPAAKGVTVKVAAVNGNCWVQAKTGGHVVFEATLQAGDSKTFTDNKQVKLILGNSGAVRLTVNGHSLGAPAGSGQISKLTFGPGDPNGAG
jgi:cytoskeletal protein RodZ